MEGTLATLIGPAYQSAQGHVPFAGLHRHHRERRRRSRNAIGATIGRELAELGPGRQSRTRPHRGDEQSVHGSGQHDDRSARSPKPCSAKETMASFTSDPAPGTCSERSCTRPRTILGPAHEYKVKGKADAQVFGGPLASMLEELKAQSGALYYIDYAKKKGIIDDKLAAQTYLHDIIWSFGHISRGMYDENKKPKPYSQLSAIQLGFLIEEGAVQFVENALGCQRRRQRRADRPHRQSFRRRSRSS